MTGYVTAAVAVLIFSSYPIATRAGVVGAFKPDDLVLLRFGIATLLFLPYILMRLRGMPPRVWRAGAALTLYQGAGMAALVVCGLQFAPASHAAALGPGVAPAWAILFGYLLFARRQPAARLTGTALIAVGAAVLVCISGYASPEVLLGDALFLGASALGALYFLKLRDSGIGVLAGAALVSLYSAIAIAAWLLFTHASPFAGVGFSSLLWQVLWQGVLIGFVALIALNHAIAKLGGERASALMALVPVIGMMLGGIFLAEVPSGGEWIAAVVISAGVLLSALQSGRPAARSARANVSACGLSRPG
jgi:drug/metabolite transporter (DMT)-like permease